ncbi:MAG TPA: PQQ-binding-like beta-propeller repeat protein [Spirochaetota bacterium]|nr:PQQ-binding-like beta-propeller repeat protein [Spirochaetota bacterium]
MASNPHVKPLKGFDPKKALSVDESFVRLVKAGEDMFGEEFDDLASESGSENAGKECGALRTGGAIHSGFTKIELPSGRVVFAATNLKGELFFFEPDGEGLKVSGKITLQGSLYSPPVYHDGIIYCVAREGGAFAIDTGLKGAQGEPDLLSGRVIWKKRTKKGIFTEPVITGKVLLVTPLDGIYGFDAFNGPDRKIGEVLWGLSINGTVSTPVVNSGMLVIGSEDKKLRGFDYGGSRLKASWEYELSGACRVKPYVSERSMQVVAGTIDGFIYSVARDTGTYKWNFVVKAPVLSPVVAAEINGAEHFLFGADNGLFYALNATGKKVWSFATKGKIRTEALVHEGRVYFGSEDNSFYALDLRTGKPVFTCRVDGNIYGKPVVHEGRIYFGATDGFIHSLYI